MRWCLKHVCASCATVMFMLHVAFKVSVNPSYHTYYTKYHTRSTVRVQYSTLLYFKYAFCLHLPMHVYFMYCIFQF